MPEVSAPDGVRLHVEVEGAGMPVTVFAHGQPLPAIDASDWLGDGEAVLTVDLHAGTASARIWTCDLSPEYIRLNAARDHPSSSPS